MFWAFVLVPVLWHQCATTLRRRGSECATTLRRRDSECATTLRRRDSECATTLRRRDSVATVERRGTLVCYGKAEPMAAASSSS
jgi:hypothetical protein